MNDLEVPKKMLGTISNRKLEIDIEVMFIPAKEDY